MPASRISFSLRLAAALVSALVLAGCTKGGQFDPTEIFNNDMFESKKKIPGEREAVFPDGVPGTTNGVPPDLVKGYQPPPDQAETDTSTTPEPAPVAEAKPKPKPKPKPKLAAAPAQPRQAQDPAWNQKGAAAPKRISIGPASQQAAPAPQPATTDAQTAWPSPQQPAPSQNVWPAPPPTTPAAQTAQPSQSIWPNPPAPANSSR
jgi:hypothetical protein